MHDDSKDTTLPVAREIVEVYVRDAVKLPWYIDLLNTTLGTHELPRARELPLAFFLRLDGETALRLCTTAWRSDTQVGVEFSQQILERNAESRNAVLNFHTT